jgi:parvulin-like peptidyl-prolyl isomerase
VGTTIVGTVRRLLNLPAVAAAAVAALVVGTACGAAPYAARVDGTTIAQSSLDDELHAIQGNKPYQDALTQQGAPAVQGTGKGTFNSAFVAQVLNQRILLSVVHEELTKRNVKLSAADLQRGTKQVEANFTNSSGASLLTGFPASYRRLLAQRAAEVAALQAAVAGTKVDDAAIQAYYDQNKGQFDKTCVRHILVDTKEKADAARARVVGGEDFAKVAQAESKDTGSAANGGDVGCDISQFVAPFMQAASTLPVNEVSQPVQTQFGFHIIQVTSRAPAPLDDTLKAKIAQQLRQPDNKKFSELILQRLSKAKVLVNPRYGKYQPPDVAAGQPSQVVPNEPPATSKSGAGAGGSGDLAPGQQGGAGSDQGAGAGQGGADQGAGAGQGGAGQGAGAGQGSAPAP